MIHFLRETLDAHYFRDGIEAVLARPKKMDWEYVLPFVFLHAGCLLVFWTGWSPVAVAVALSLYFLRIFGVTAFMHRYFSHRTFKTSRLMQFIFAVWCGLAVQKGALWWAAHHRDHHRYSDQPEDLHSPLQSGFWWSHIGWITAAANIPTDYSKIKDFAKFPELVFLNRFDWVVPAIYSNAMLIFGLGRKPPTLNGERRLCKC